jgi:fatty acid desaturase
MSSHNNINTDQPFFDQEFSRHESRATLISLLGESTLKSLMQRSNLKGLWAIFSCWAVIITSMVVFAWAQTLPIQFSIPIMLLAIIIIAGRQLGLSILMHEASHRALFKTTWLNDRFSDWLCGRPIFIEVEKYRKHHMVHHRETGTLKDIDYSLVKNFPTTRMSLLRKFCRDILGITGIKSIIGLSLMNAGILKWTVANNIERLPQKNRSKIESIKTFIKNAWPTLTINSGLFLVTYLAGHPEMFLAWVLAYLSPYQLFIRIRSIAEHAMTKQTPNMLENTRSTNAGWIARALVAPFNVNFHIEHHIMPTLSFWQLPKLHKLLSDKGVVTISSGYLKILKKVSSN